MEQVDQNKKGGRWDEQSDFNLVLLMVHFKIVQGYIFTPAKIKLYGYLIFPAR